MGGRGSLYLNFYNPNHNSMPNLDIANIISTQDQDKDTLKEYNGKTEKLRNKKIFIKESTDLIPENIFKPNINKIDHLTRKYLDSTQILKNQNKQMSIRSIKLNNLTTACYISNNHNLNNLQIILNDKIKHTKKSSLETNVQKIIDRGYWVKTDKKELVNQAITHEFGHHIQRVLMELDKTTSSGRERYNNYLEDVKKAKTKSQIKNLGNKFFEDYATEYFKAIQRIERKEFNHITTHDELSGYSTESNSEAFAELFAKANCTKDKDTLSKSMDLFLSKKMKVAARSN